MKSRINLGTINLTCSIDTCTCMYTRLFVLPSVALKVMNTSGSSGWVPERSGSLYCWHSALMCTTPLLANTCRPHSIHLSLWTYYNIQVYVGKKSATRVPKLPFNYALCLSTQWTLCSWRSCKNEHQRWCQKNLPNVIPKEPLQQQTHLIWTLILECRWWDSVQRSSPQNTGWAEKVTQLCLEKWDLHVGLYTHTKLAHFIPRCLENVKKKIKEAILVTNISVIRYKMNKE